jgi:hypothetical protein
MAILLKRYSGLLYSVVDAAVVAVEAGAEAASVVVDSADLAAVVVEVAALPVDGKASMNCIDNKKPLQCCRGFLL